MTTRDEVRRSRAEARDGDRAYATEAGPSLPERLVAARERKGVDIYRAERDTKIRARYLEALEHGDYRELPGAVYTKGFLRNYALYLGLDPEEVLLQWKHERGDAAIPAEPVLAVPKPLAAPRQGLTFSPVVVVAALLTVLIGVFAIYMGIQLVRFAKPPTLEVTNPSQLVIDVPEETTTYTLRGTSIPGATITITAAGRDQPYRVSADSAGRWSTDVDLRRGRNQFDITAVDPDTGKTAETSPRIFITVPFLVVEAPTLNLTSPAEGSQFQNGAIPVKGVTTNAKTVAVAANLVAPAGAPVPSAAASPSASAAPTVGPVTVDVAADGTFDTPLDLSAGSWRIEVTATSTGGKAVTLTRNVSVQYRGVNLVVTIKGSKAWLKVWVDGKVSDVTGTAGATFGPGKVLTFTAKNSVEVRTGKSNVTYFTLNGKDLGRMSAKGNPETWLFAPPADPVKTNRT
ncbi:MAG TPA: helix-turn-helix domain-containing protein [Candidatus Limnocylindrales bacterium]